VLDVDTLLAAIMGAEGQHSRDIGRDLPLKTAVLHKRRCSTKARCVSPSEAQRERALHVGHFGLYVHAVRLKPGAPKRPTRRLRVAVLQRVEGVD